jgi:hypothetical protein
VFVRWRHLRVLGETVLRLHIVRDVGDTGSPNGAPSGGSVGIWACLRTRLSTILGAFEAFAPPKGTLPLLLELGWIVRSTVIKGQNNLRSETCAFCRAIYTVQRLDDLQFRDFGFIRLKMYVSPDYRAIFSQTRLWSSLPASLILFQTLD